MKLKSLDFHIVAVVSGARAATLSLWDVPSPPDYLTQESDTEGDFKYSCHLFILSGYLYHEA
jgi:hypothetical protein